MNMQRNRIVEGNELVLLDWSGTCSDDRPAVYETNMRIMELYGKEKISFEKWREVNVNAFDAPSFHKLAGIHEDPEEIRRLFRKYFDEFVSNGLRPTAYPGLAETLEKIKSAGKALAVVSSHMPENLRAEAKRYGVANFFDLIVGGSISKPYDLLYVCRAMSIIPKRGIYMGDIPYDINSARIAGLASGVVCNGFATREALERAGPDLLLEDLNELPLHI